MIIERRVFDFRMQEEKYGQPFKPIYRPLTIVFRTAAKIGGRIAPAPWSKLFLRECSMY